MWITQAEALRRLPRGGAGRWAALSARGGRGRPVRDRAGDPAPVMSRGWVHSVACPNEVEDSIVVALESDRPSSFAHVHSAESRVGDILHDRA